MSQLVKAVMAHDTGNRAVLENKFSPLFVDVFEKKEHIDQTYDQCLVGKRYRIGVTLGSHTIVSEFDMMQDKDALALAIERAKRSIIEAVFGEFRQDIMQLQNAIYDRDFQKSRTILTNLEDKMFSVE